MTASGQAHTGGGKPQFRHWARLNLPQLLFFLGLLISTISFIVLTISAAKRGNFRYVWINIPATVYVLTWLSLATIGVRTIGLRYVVRAFFVGAFLTVAIGFPLAKLMKIPFGETPFTVAVW